MTRCGLAMGCTDMTRLYHLPDISTLRERDQQSAFGRSSVRVKPLTGVQFCDMVFRAFRRVQRVPFRGGYQNGRRDTDDV